MKLKQTLFSTFLLATSFQVMAQQKITLTECYEMAKNNYPLIKQKELIIKSSEYNIANIEKGILPQLNITGQITYQSDVTSIPIKLPNVNIEEPSKTQYKVVGEVTQTITDLYTVKEQKNLQKANAEVQVQNWEVEMYKIKDRINQLYFGILLVDEQIKLNELVDADLQTGMNKITAAIKNGVEYKSSLDKIKAELIKNKQRKIELTAQRKVFSDMLGYFINKSVDEKTTLVKPEAPANTFNITRPELTVFDKKNKMLDIQKKIILNRNIPKLSFFFQGGVGNPSPLNMISAKSAPFYISGLRLNWPLMNLYTQKKEKALLENERAMNNLQKETFLFNTNMQVKQQNNELIKLNELINTDDELVAIRNSVKNTSKVQLENGIITSNDYIKEVNAEDQARQNKLLHEIQLLVAQYNLQNTTGN